MSVRRVYLAKYRTTPRQRAHFAIFIPNNSSDRISLAQDFETVSTVGTIIHVVGEPVMAGYTHEFKRGYIASDSRNLAELVFLGTADVANIFESSTGTFIREGTPHGRFEREAVQVAPPPRGQNIRAPVDGVNTKRCQEWTMEFLQRLATKGLIQQEAVARAQVHRDPPTHGIFGAGGAVPQQRPADQVVAQPAVGSDWIWDDAFKRYRRWDGEKWVWQ